MTPDRLSRLRQGVYRVAGAGFAHPDTELITAADDVMGVLEELGVFDFAFAPDLAMAAAEFARADPDEISAAYVALFEAGVAGAACPPHESAYRTDPRTGEVAVLMSDLKRAILRYGLAVDADAADMIDHVSAELGVMAALARRQGDLHEAGKPVRQVIANQFEFLSEHLLSWVPRFTEAVGSRERHPAYTALGVATSSFLSQERQLLALLTGDTVEVS